MEVLPLSSGQVAHQRPRTRSFAAIIGVVTAALSATVFLMTPESFRMMVSIPAQRVSYPSTSCQGSTARGQGVSGRLFQGKPFREFTRPLRFHEGIKVSRPDLPAGAITSQKWAVCTTIHHPTQAILDFIQQETEWAIVVVGDEGMESFEISGNKAVFLDANAQRDMADGYKDFFRLLPWKHFGRKNVGYLYAILHGAEQVWDFDDDNFLQDNTFPTVPLPSQIRDVVLSQDCAAFNPLPFMGGDGPPNPMWPRGFPLNLIHTACPFILSPHNGQPSKNAVYQSLADNEPDVDGIYRLTRTTPMTFRRSTSPEDDLTLSIPAGSLSPYNAQATLVLQPALWSLLLPVTIHGRVSDIWRSYIAQRLLWDAGYQIAFTPPMVVQYRNAHNYLADMQAEEDLYFKAPALVELLRSWRGKAPTLAGRYEELMVSLYERGFVEEGDVLLTQEWLTALGQVGYELPPVAAEDWTQALPEHTKKEVSESLSPAETTPSDVKRAPRSCTSEYWAVLPLTESSPNDDAVRALLALPGLQPCIAVVALEKSITQSTTSMAQDLLAHPQMVFLGAEEQAALPYATVQLLPWSHLSRKNLGYLYAIEHGAKAILDTDGTVVATPGKEQQGLIGGYSATVDVQEVYPAHRVFNAYTLVDRADLWPRGMLKQDHDNPNSNVKDGKNLAGNVLEPFPQSNIHILHSLIPDLAASSALPPEEGFTDTSPWSLPRNTFVPYNSLSTLHRHKALFGLMLPATTTTSIADIVRGYVTQRLLWEVGGYVALVSAWGQRVATQEDKQRQQQEEERHADKIQVVLDYLSSEWQPDGQPLDVSLRDIYHHLHEVGIVDEADVHLSQSWMADLKGVGYELAEVPPLAPTFPAITTDPPRFAMATQDRVSLLARWLPIGEAVEGLDLFLLSYDAPMDPQLCQKPGVTCIFGEGTTWTTGRNLLAKTIHDTEKAKGITYKYWMFADGDISTTECDRCKGTDCGPVCFVDFVDQYLRSAQFNPPVVAYAYPGSCRFPQWDNREAVEVDAMFNAFHRQAVPFLLPYSTHMDDYSWWESQAFLFYAWGACLGSNHPTVVVSYCHYSPSQNDHVDYPRNSVAAVRDQRRQYFKEDFNDHGIEGPYFETPLANTERLAPDAIMPFVGGSGNITWYQRNGKRWWEFYEARLCTAKLDDRFQAAMGVAVPLSAGAA